MALDKILSRPRYVLWCPWNWENSEIAKYRDKFNYVHEED